MGFGNHTGMHVRSDMPKMNGAFDLTENACIVGGAATPFDYGPSGWENPENGAVECIKEMTQPVYEWVKTLK